MPRTFVWHRTRGPKKTDANTLTEGDVRIVQVRSGIGQTARMRANLQALGLRHHQGEVVKPDSPALRGQIKRVRHLVTVAPLTKKEKAEHKKADKDDHEKAEKSGQMKSEKAEHAKKEKAEHKEK